MHTVRHQRGDSMTFGNFFLSSSDSTPVMVAKVTPALTLATVSANEGAQSFLDHFASLPWGAISGCAATVYSLCLLSEWVFKKIRAFIEWRQAQ